MERTNNSYLANAKEFEPKLRDVWKSLGVNKAFNPDEPGFDPEREKYIILDFFPFPSGRGLHIGHPRGYVATDVIARAKRMQGYNVLYSMGFDSFGLPTEQYAIETGQQPAIANRRNIENMQKQLEGLGLSHDQDRSFSTSDPGFYKWTQSIFVKLYNSYYDPTIRWLSPSGQIINGRAQPISSLIQKLQSGEWLVSSEGKPVPQAIAENDAKLLTVQDDIHSILNNARLAYLEDTNVKWCPMLGTVLSKEEITPEGLSERGNHPVYDKKLRQWVMRITAYADRLADDLDLVNWPESTKVMQKNWIGRQEHTTPEGEIVKSYNLHDWVFSRQRYWGEPFPIVCDNKGLSYAISDDQLPVILPQIDDFRPVVSDDPIREVEAPLSRATTWVNVKGKKMTTEQ